MLRWQSQFILFFQAISLEICRSPQIPARFEHFDTIAKEIALEIKRKGIASRINWEDDGVVRALAREAINDHHRIVELATSPRN